MNAQTAYALQTKPAAVLCDGPFETGPDDSPQFSVTFADDDGQPIEENKSAMWTFDDAAAAARFTRELARKYSLEPIIESTQP